MVARADYIATLAEPRRTDVAALIREHAPGLEPGGRWPSSSPRPRGSGPRDAADSGRA